MSDKEPTFDTGASTSTGDAPISAPRFAGPPSQGWRRSSRWTRLCLKELRETLRDRRTLITLVLMPLLVYPVLSMVFQKSLLTAFTGGQQRVVIGVKSKQTANILRHALLVGDVYLKNSGRESLDAVDLLKAATLQQREAEASADSSNEDDESKSSPIPSLGAPQQLTELGVDEITFLQHSDLRGQVEAEKIDLGILLPSESDTKSVELIHREGSSLSARALRFVERRLDAMNELLLRRKLRDNGVSAELAFVRTRQTIAENRKDNTLSTIVPMILILMTVTGAVYPAIDLTAGERERGTLEMLMASPVSRLKLLMAKYVAVVAVAVLTALVNLTAMTITLQATGIGRVLFGQAGLSFVRVLQILSLLVLFAAFFSAVLLALTSFARSFKEAQAYLIPLMLLSLGPGIVSLLPGLELKGVLAITPVSNMVLLARDLCSGGANPLMAAVAILSTGIYTLAAIGVAAKIFGTDAVMSGGQGALKNLFVPADGQQTDDGVSSVSGALLCLAVLFPVYFLTSNVLAQFAAWPLTARLMVSAIATSTLFGAVPLGAAVLQRLNLRRAFGITPAFAGAFTVAVLLGLTLWPIAYEIVMLVEMLGVSSIQPSLLESAKGLLTELKTVSPVLILLSMAIVPAVFEELFFRGYLFAALKKSSSRNTTIVASATLFGLFHVISNGALSVERFPPSAFLGLVLGWLCYKSGSVLPGMFLHACHNGLLMSMAYFKDELAARGFGIEEQTHLPMSWVAISVFSLIFGIVFIAFLPTKREHYASQRI